MRLLALFIPMLMIMPCAAAAKNCGEMTKELRRLRVEYHEFVTGPGAENDNKSFEELTDKLDKIVDLKNEMRKASCEIPPRPKKFKKKR